MFNHVTPYRYLLPNLYLSVADIANPDLLACGGRTWIIRSIASHPAGPHGQLIITYITITILSPMSSFVNRCRFADLT